MAARTPAQLISARQATGTSYSGAGAVLQRVLQGISPIAARQLAPKAIKAAEETGIPASVLLAVSGQESAYGTNRATSSAGARGAGNFIPSTGAYIGKKYGVNPFNYGKQGLEAAGYYLKELGFKKDPQAALSGYSGGYAPSAYNDPILQQAKAFHKAGLDRVSAQGLSGSGRARGGPYVYPFGKGIAIGRTDMGIDPYPTGKGTTIRTIGRAKYLGTGGSGWPSEGGSGTGPVYKLLKGPQAGKKVYTYEGISARSGLKPGDILRKGTPIAKATGSSFETGFAFGAGKSFQPVASTHYSEGDVTPEGQAFKRFIQSTQSNRSYPTNIGGVSFGGTLGGGGAGALGTAAGSSSIGQALSSASPGQAKQILTQLLSGGGGGSGGAVGTSLLEALLPQKPTPGGLAAAEEGDPQGLLSQAFGDAYKPRQRRTYRS